jgi:hypothetical protein
MCGATSAQNTVQAQQTENMKQAAQQASSIYGDNQSAYQSLMNTFAPTVAAGPNQQGFNQQQMSNLDSQAITQTGQSYKNEKEALGDQQAAAGGGTAVLPGGAGIAQRDALAENAGNQTASQLSGITQAGYAQGNANYNNAVTGLAGAGNVFNSGTQATNASTNSSSAAGTTANQIAQENNSWVQGLTGALGGIVGAAAGNPAGLLSSASGLFGGGGNGSNTGDAATTSAQQANYDNLPAAYGGGGS